MKVQKLLALALVVVMLLGCMTLVAFADGENTSELDNGTNSSQDLSQNYTFKHAGDIIYTDVSMIKIEWEIADVSVTYEKHMNWDPETLSWVETKKEPQTTTFTLTNYSSHDIYVFTGFTVDNEVKDRLKTDESSIENNSCKVETPVKQEDLASYTDSEFVSLSESVTAKLKFNLGLFERDSEIAIGTYTLTIANTQEEINPLSEASWITIPEDEEEGMPIWVLLLIILGALILLAVVLFFLWKHDHDNGSGKLGFLDGIFEPINEAFFHKGNDAEDNLDVDDSQGLTLSESMAILADMGKSVVSKKTIADYLEKQFGEDVLVNRRANYTRASAKSKRTEGLPLADTHYVVQGKQKICFVFVYENKKGAVLLLLRITRALAQKLEKKHPTIVISKFPKVTKGLPWYSLPIDPSYTLENVKTILNDAFNCHKK